MAPMTNTEKQQAFRDRQKAKKIADEYFGGIVSLTIEEFMAVAAFDDKSFRKALDGSRCGETDEYMEIRLEAEGPIFDEAYKKSYTQTLQQSGLYRRLLEKVDGIEDRALEIIEYAASEEGWDYDNEEFCRAARQENNWAHKQAAQDAEDAVFYFDPPKPSDYEDTCVIYDLVDLLAAYRKAVPICKL